VFVLPNVEYVLVKGMRDTDPAKRKADEKSFDVKGLSKKKETKPLPATGSRKGEEPADGE